MYSIKESFETLPVGLTNKVKTLECHLEEGMYELLMDYLVGKFYTSDPLLGAFWILSKVNHKTSRGVASVANHIASVINIECYYTKVPANMIRLRDALVSIEIKGSRQAKMKLIKAPC